MIPALALGAALGALPPVSVAVIVANNDPRPEEASLKPLRFADDDGAQYYELLTLEAGEDVFLHSVLDEESQRLHPEATRAARPPTRADLERSLDRAFERLEAARAQGRTTELYFVFVGHGSVTESGEGVMHLLDGGFSRSDLFQRVVARSPADINHVIVDACNAFLFVAGRGEDDGADFDRAVDQYLAQETLRRHPNTGFLLSTSAADEVHEWSGFRSGVFSHEVRSALRGGADVDRDGRVTYSEVEAFVQAANARVRDPRARIQPWVFAPAIRRTAPIFDRSGLVGPTALLDIDETLAGRWVVEDSRGVRVADVHLASDGPVTLTLSAEHDHVLRSAGFEIPIPSTALRSIEARHLKRSALSVRRRGSVQVSFREDLFAVPFGRAFYDGYATRPATTPWALRAEVEPEGSVRPVIGASLAGLGVVSAAAGVTLALLAQADARAYREGIGLASDLEAVRSRAQGRRTASSVLLGLGGALAAAGALVWAW